MSSEAVKQIEAAAPVLTDGPLPLTVDTLAYIPASRRDSYSRAMTGAFQLTHIAFDDSASRAAYVKEIAAGKVGVLPEGMTRAEVAEGERLQAERSAMVKSEIARLEVQQRAERIKAIEKKAADDRVALDRRIALERRGVLTGW